MWEGRLLAVVTAVLVVFGLAAVYGASSLVTVAGGQVGASFALRQAIGAVVGGLLAIVFARLDYHRWKQWAWPLLGVTVLLLLIPLLPFTHPITPTINGARRWVNLGFLTLQPSELAKFAVVVWCAMLAAKKGEQVRNFQQGLLPFVVILVPVIGLIFLEPHLSMALLVAILAGSVLFTAGARIGHFLALGVASTPLLFGAVATAQYRVARVLTFLNPAPHPRKPRGRCSNRSPASGRGSSSARVSDRASRSSATCRMRTPISFSRRSERNGVSSACSRSRCCSAPSCGSAFASRATRRIRSANSSPPASA